MPNRPFYLVPVLIAGLATGVPASVCCCSPILTMFGGLFAVWLIRRRSGGLPIEVGEGAIIGGLVGAVTGVMATGVSAVLRVLFEQYLMNFQAQMTGTGMPEMSIQSGEGLIGFVVGAVVTLVMNLVFGTIGGLVSTFVLKTSASAAPPQQG